MFTYFSKLRQFCRLFSKSVTECHDIQVELEDYR